MRGGYFHQYKSRNIDWKIHGLYVGHVDYNSAQSSSHVGGKMLMQPVSLDKLCNLEFKKKKKKNLLLYCNVLDPL